MVTSHFTRSSIKAQCWAGLSLEFNGLIRLAKHLTINEPKPAIASFLVQSWKAPKLRDADLLPNVRYSRT